MTNKNQSRMSWRDRLTFFSEFIKHPLQIGSVIPSSRFMEQRLLKTADIASARTIVELGTGTGSTTRAILAAMSPEARLLCIEINPRFCRLIEAIDDDRLIVHLGDARDLRELLATHNLGAADVVISGIPFSTMSPGVGADILATIATVLTPNGRFVAYQVSNRVASLCQPILGKAGVQLELLNIPPMWVFRWEKSDS